MYKKRIVAMIAAFSLLTACGSNSSVQESTSSATVSVSEPAPSVSLAESTEEIGSVVASVDGGSMGLSFDETDLMEAVTGLEDVYVVQGAENINFLDNVIYDAALIVSITWDASQVDLETPGEYPVTYIVTVNQDAMDAYLGGTYDPAQDYSNSSTVEVVIEKTVTVCTAEDSTAQADAGIYVLADDGQYAETSDGKQPAARQPVRPASTDVTGGTPICADTGTEPEADLAQPTPTPSTTPVSASPSETAATSSDTPHDTKDPDDTDEMPKPSASTPSPTPAPTPSKTPTPTATPTPSKTPTPSPSPTHTHTWVTQEATGHYEKVQTGTQKVQTGTIYHSEGRDPYTVYQCNACGATFYDEISVSDHMAFGNCGAGYSTWVEYSWYEEWEEPVYEEQPVYSEVWVEDTPAYEYCSTCGQRR